MKKETHAVMPSTLARALIEAGVKHFDAGGGVGPMVQGGIGGFLTPQTAFQASVPSINTQNFTPQISTLNQEQQDIYNQQKNLAQALLARSQGQGPNPVASELATQTGNNIAAQSALMASARGASANPGLTARLAAEQGGQIQQQAVGQAATLQAEEELAAQKELQNLYGQEAGANTSNLGVLQGANASQNSAQTTGQLGTSQINAQVASENTKNAASTTGGLIGGIGSFLGLSKGGKVPFYRTIKMADGGIATFSTPIDPHILLNVDGAAPDQSIEKGLGHGNLKKFTGSFGSSDDIGASGTTDLVNPISAPSSNLMDLTPGATPGTLLASRGGAIDERAGGKIPGKAQVKGDSEKNDKVPALLSPGEEVLPRSVTMAPDAPERAKKFVEALKDRKGESTGYGKVIKAKRTLKERVEHLEKLCAGGMA